IREARRNGGDVVTAVKRRPRLSKTFGQAAELRIAAHEEGWRHPKSKEQWTNSLKRYAAAIWDKNVADVDEEDVKAILEPIWRTKIVTARRVRHRVEKVLDFAKTQKWRDGENPAKWVGHLAEVLPRMPRLAKGHYPACPVDQVPAF